MIVANIVVTILIFFPKTNDQINYLRVSKWAIRGNLNNKIGRIHFCSLIMTIKEIRFAPPVILNIFCLAQFSDGIVFGIGCSNNDHKISAFRRPNTVNLVQKYLFTKHLFENFSTEPATTETGLNKNHYSRLGETFFIVHKDTPY